MNALALLQLRLGTSLSAAQLHGSAVAEGPRKRCGVDLLAVTIDPLTDSVRARLPSGLKTADLMTAFGHHPFDSAGRPPLEG